jgi:uncharacterized protein (TIGR03118 family)
MMARFLHSALALLALATFVGPASALEVTQINLVSSNTSTVPAQHQDPNMVNAWGVSFSPTGSPFWISDNGTNQSSLYSVNPTTNKATEVTGSIFPVDVPKPTGQVFGNVAGSFNNDTFLFVSGNGSLYGWRGALGKNAEVLFTGAAGTNYTGSAIGTLNGTTFLYAANSHGGIDVIKGTNGSIGLDTTDFVNKFVDPNIPTNYHTYNIQRLGDTLYVTYTNGRSGGGYVDAYRLDGTFISRVASNGSLQDPWGMTIAPKSFGALAGDLLVGNLGDGKISAYNISNLANGGTFDGQLLDKNGKVLSIDGLWALTTGNDGSAGSSQKVYFTAGPNFYSAGLFGVLEAAPEPSTGLLGMLGAVVLAGWKLRSRWTGV